MPRAEVHKLMERMAIPAIAAPMFLVSNPALTLACCGEGIMGSFPAHGTRSREQFQAWLDEMQDGMKRLEDAGRKPAPWAVNLVVHASNPRYPGDLELVEKYKVPVVLTSKGAPGDAIKRIHGWGAVALHDIANRRHAEKALEAGVDGVIAVAGGAGGHTGTINPFALMNEVRQLGDHFAVVLAGGQTTGRDVLAAEAMGADLAYIGTRFIATQEAMAAAAHKDMILKTRATDVFLTASIDGAPANWLTPQPSRRRHRPRRPAHDLAQQDRVGAGQQEALEGHLYGGPRRREHRGHPDGGGALPAADRAVSGGEDGDVAILRRWPTDAASSRQRGELVSATRQPHPEEPHDVRRLEGWRGADVFRFAQRLRWRQLRPALGFAPRLQGEEREDKGGSLLRGRQEPRDRGSRPRRAEVRRGAGRDQGVGRLPHRRVHALGRRSRGPVPGDLRPRGRGRRGRCRAGHRVAQEGRPRDPALHARMPRLQILPVGQDQPLHRHPRRPRARA